MHDARLGGGLPEIHVNVDDVEIAGIHPAQELIYCSGVKLLYHDDATTCPSERGKVRVLVASIVYCTTRAKK
jgi:hypothetical protein